MVVHAEYPFGESRVERQAEALVEAGQRVDVICLRTKGQPTRERIGGVGVTRLPVRRHKDVAAAVQLAEYLAFLLLATAVLAWRSGRYRTVQLHTPPDFIVFAALPNRLRGARVLLDVHDLSPEFAQERFGLRPGAPLVRLLAAVERISCRFADQVVTVSDHWRDVLVERTGIRDCAVVPNVPGARFFTRAARARPPVPGRSLRAVYHGTIRPRHGLDVAIRSVAMLRDRGVHVRLCIRGRGLVEPLRRLVDQLDLNDRVEFAIGLVPYEDLAPALADADLGLVLYRPGVLTDGIVPTKLLEYAFLDLPAVASRTTGVTSVFDDETCILVPPEDPAAVADAIERLAADPDELARYRRALAEFRECHDPDELASAYVGLIGRVGAAGRSRP